MPRTSGILLHITSLPGPHGIGTMGREAEKFIKFLKRSGQTWWQILPLGPTGFGNSPYQSYSTFAGNPNLIDLEELVEEGFLKAKELEKLNFGRNPAKIDFPKLEAAKQRALRIAFRRSRWRLNRHMRAFREREKGWLRDYALFMALKTEFKGDSWQKWPEALRIREPQALEAVEKRLRREIDYWIFVQYIFDRQWTRIRKIATENGISIMGDVPIYVSTDSADTWASPEMFLLDEDRNPLVVAGCPPDGFSDTGQLWGNPIYNWPLHEENGYTWWIERVRRHAELFDKTRVDHFRGFESYWEIPAGEHTAVNGRWVKGPGMKLFDAIEKKVGKLDLVAEDLGFLTEEVHGFRNMSGFPGMKVLQFAFDVREESDYLTHLYEKHCVVYTGTHDNNTVRGWLDTVQVSDMIHACRYLNLTREEGLNWGFIRGAWSSVGDLAIAQMQDFLDLGSEARMNVPSTVGDHNWSWRMVPGKLTEELADRIYQMTKLYGRVRGDVQ